MTPDSIDLVQRSFNRLLGAANEAEDVFFTRLFTSAPELRGLFPAELGHQRRRLMATLGFAVKTLDDFEDIVPLLCALAAEYHRAGMRKAHFAAYCAAILYTLEARLGVDWTPAHRDAWAEFFGVLVQSVRADVPNTAAAA
jgi:nitric oxide dioxygenase